MAPDRASRMVRSASRGPVEQRGVGMSVFPDRMRLRGGRRTWRPGGRSAVAVLALAFAAAGCTGSGDEDATRGGRQARRPDARRDRPHPSARGTAEGRGSPSSAGSRERTSSSSGRTSSRRRPPPRPGCSSSTRSTRSSPSRTSRSRRHRRRRAEGDGIPVVFLHPSDPVRDGLVESLSHPEREPHGGLRRPRRGRQAARGLPARRPEPPATADARRPDGQADGAAPEGRAGAPSAQLRRPLELDVREATTAKDIERVFRSLRPGEVDGVFLLSPSLRLNHTALTIELAKKARLPVQAHRKEWVEQGALFSYGIDLAPHRASRRALRRQHPQGHAAGRASPSRRSRSSSSRSISRRPAGSGSSRRRRSSSAPTGLPVGPRPRSLGAAWNRPSGHTAA